MDKLSKPIIRPSDHLGYGSVVAFRDGLVLFQLSSRAILMESAVESLQAVIPAAAPFLSFAAWQSGQGEHVADFVEALGKWAEQQTARQTEAGLSAKQAAARGAFFLPFVNIVEATHYRLDAANIFERINEHWPQARMVLTLEDARGNRNKYSVSAEGEKEEGIALAFMNARIAAEVAALTRSVDTERLGPSFWSALIEKRTAELEQASAQRRREIISELWEEAKQQRASAGLTEQTVAQAVLARMAPTLPALRRVPPMTPAGINEVAMLEAKARGLGYASP